MQKPLILIVFSVVMGVAGQYFFKLGMSKVGIVNFDWQIIKYFFKPLILMGLVCYAAATASWLVVLSKSELSFAYPLISLGYILVVLVGLIIFKEKVSLLRFLGVLLICGGVFLTIKS
ncbi:MAG: EamA family transporter [Armatimonadota bacterium]